MSTEPDERLGSTIAERYRLDRLLGQGGYGDVYGGVHVGTGRAIAVKLLRPEHHKPAVLKRFLNEARVVGQLEHPNVVSILDVGHADDGTAYLVFELLRGESLGERLASERRLDPRSVCEIAAPLLDALGALHDRGVVHRDVKPDNIFLSVDSQQRMTPKLLDLGISKDQSLELTATQAVLGTPRYMSPEQVRSSAEVTPATDLWSMGVVLYESLAGRPPFDGHSNAALLIRIQTEDPTPLLSSAPDVPPALATLIERALSRDPGNRPTTARAFRDELVAVAMREGWSSPPPPRPVARGLISGDEATLLAAGERVQLPAVDSIPQVNVHRVDPQITEATPSTGARSGGASYRWIVVALALAPIAAFAMWATVRWAGEQSHPSRPRVGPSDPAVLVREGGALGAAVEIDVSDARPHPVDVAVDRADPPAIPEDTERDHRDVAPLRGDTETPRAPRAVRVRPPVAPADAPPPVPRGNNGAPIIRD